MEENVVGTLISRMDENLREMFLAYWLGTSAVAIIILMVVMAIRSLLAWIFSRIKRQKERVRPRGQANIGD